jgi:NAD-reducing hydrogenase small subunit
MSLLDMDESLIDLMAQVEILSGPLVDRKVFPNQVDVTLVEGAVSNEADRKNIAMIRARSGVLVSFGDCAITANVPGMRNRFPVDEVIRRAYKENADPALPGGVPFQTVPCLCQEARPVHEFVSVDFYLPGCPPPPAAILHLLSELAAGRSPDMRGRTRFGA